MLTLMECGRNSSPKMDTEVFVLNATQLEHYWPRIEAELDAEPDLWSNWFSKEGAFARLLGGTLQAWTVCETDGPIHALFFTQMSMGEEGTTLQVLWMRGELPEGALKSISLALDVYGYAHGCKRIAVLGRPGWARVLRDLGGKVDYVQVSRLIHAPVLQ